MSNYLSDFLISPVEHVLPVTDWNKKSRLQIADSIKNKSDSYLRNIMSIITRLGRSFREKPKSTNLNLPSLPVPREILEDIETCHSNDPVLALATVIQRKGKGKISTRFIYDKSSQVFCDVIQIKLWDLTWSVSYLMLTGRPSLLDTDLIEEPTTIRQSPLGFLAPYQIDNLDSSDDTSVARTTSTSKRRGSTSMTHSGTAGGTTIKKSDAEKINSYNKLKQFLLLYEKSEELMDGLEPHFKRIEVTLKACKNYSTTTTQSQLEHDTDADNASSSPLMWQYLSRKIYSTSPTFQLNKT